MIKEILNSIRPVYVEECLGEHKRRSLARVGAIQMTNQFSGIFLNLIRTVVLSRLLSPSTFGLVAMVLFFRGLLQIFGAAGFVEAAVQKKNLTLNQLNTIFSLNAAVCTILALIFIASAPLISSFYGEPELTTLCVVYGLLFIIENLFLTHSALLRRTMNTELQLIVTLFPQIIGLTVSIIMALNGFEVWSLVGGTVVSTVVSRLVYLYFVRWKPGRFVIETGFREIFHYGLKSSSATIVNYCSLYSQNLALGKFGSVADVGYYNRGQAIFLMPIQVITQPIAQLMLPSFAVLQDQKEKLLDLLLRATWLVNLIVMPLTVFMIVFGDWAVTLLLGDQWAVSGKVTQWLAVASVPILVSNLLGRGNAAIGRPGRGVPVAVASLPFLLIGVAFYAADGPVAIAIVYTIYRWAFYPFSIAIHLRGSGFSCREFLSSQVGLFSITAIAVIFLSGLRVIADGAEGIQRVGLMTLSFVLCYVVFVFLYSYFKYGASVMEWIERKLKNRISVIKNL